MSRIRFWSDDARPFHGKLILLGRVLLLSVFCVLAACEIDTSITLDGNTPPTFRLSGSGGINFFQVVETPSSGQSISEAHVLWEIKPDAELYETPASKLPSITYGKVPVKFTQTKPESNSLPSLVEGRLYTAWSPTYNANGGGVVFTIREGKSVVIRNL